jgi:hypothetical protein
MSGFYRFGKPGEDTWAHINTGRRGSAKPCEMCRFKKDNPNLPFEDMCGRMSVALCDAPGCDKPICDLHRTKHPTKADTDFCTAHAPMAGL